LDWALYWFIFPVSIPAAPFSAASWSGGRLPFYLCPLLILRSEAPCVVQVLLCDEPSEDRRIGERLWGRTFVAWVPALCGTSRIIGGRGRWLALYARRGCLRR